jgi:DNA-binding NarL/FixJ family response regulator
MNAHGIARVLAKAPDLCLQGCCYNPASVAKAVEVQRPDVVLLDPDLYESDPLRALTRVRDVAPDAHILLVITKVDERLIQALSQDQVSCVSAYAEGHHVLSAIRALIAREPVFPREVQAALAARIREPLASRRSLTIRERQVFELAATGLTASAIARVLHISPSTAKAHLHHVYAKLGAPNRSAAITIAMRTGQLAPLQPTCLAVSRCP